MNDKPNTEVEELKPFTKFIYTLGQLPSSYLASMSYEEQLIWLCNYLAQTVIPTVNNNGEAVSELQNLFIELQKYVNNYFDNLDVQEEINTKLDEMAEDGTLINLLRSYIDPIYLEYEDTINTEFQEFKSSVNDDIDSFKSETQSDISSFESQVTNEITSLTSQIQSSVSGSPAGVYSTVSDLETDNPDHDKIYLVLADGNWYYYDTSDSAWTSGGTYQSTGVGIGEVEYSNLNDDLKNIFSIPISTTVVSGKYIKTDGTEASSVVYSHTNPFELKKDHTIFLLGEVGEIVSAIAEYDSVNETYIPLVSGYDNEDIVRKWYYTAPYDMQIVLSYRNNRNFNYFSYISSFKLLSKINDTYPYKYFGYTITSGKYINANTSAMGSSTAYELSSPISLSKGETMNIRCVAGVLVSPISEYNPLNQTYKALTNGPSDTPTLKDFSYTAPKDMYVVLSYNKSYDHNSYINMFYAQNDLYDYIENKTDKSFQNISTMFNEITAIGDSLTYSQVYLKSTTPNRSRQAYKPWPTVFGNLSGATATNLGYSGISSSEWWTAHNTELTNTNHGNLFIIYLGTNYGLTDTLSTDAPENEPYSDWANTNTGGYAKIVAKCQELGGSVLLIKPYVTGGEGGASLETTLSVIDQISTRFNVPVIEPIDLTDNVYHRWPSDLGYNSIHLNDYGYTTFAQILINRINKLSVADIKKIWPK